MKEMGKTAIFISGLIMMVLTSCMSAEHVQDNDMFGSISGIVTDMNGNALEHISVTIRLADNNDSQTFYTSSEGRFLFDLPMSENDGQIKFMIILKDVDGEENGGLFQERTEEITVFEEDYNDFPVMIELPPYRLTPATVSENTPQS